MPKKREPQDRKGPSAEASEPLLSVVATPIGNLTDLSRRAFDTLASVDVILCEDTRRTRELMSALKIDLHGRELLRFDAHTTPSDARQILSRLCARGGHWALVTDAGTPAISDPGALCVRQAREQGIAVQAIPGPSALAAFLSISGSLARSFMFRGFFPRTEQDRTAEFEKLRGFSEENAVFIVYFESPERIEQTLGAISQAFPNAIISVAKELTKVYETFFTGTADHVLTQIRANDDSKRLRGEWVLGIEVSEVKTAAISNESRTEWKTTIECLMACEVPVKQAAKVVSDRYDVSRNEAYEYAIEKKSASR